MIEISRSDEVSKMRTLKKGRKDKVLGVLHLGGPKKWSPQGIVLRIELDIAPAN